jgi:hypothetical protein
MADRTSEIELEPEQEEDEVYVQYDIATYPSDHTLMGMAELWHRGDIVIPDFQREFVWTIKQSSLLIESFLLGLPVPPVFFYIDEDNKSLVIDGQQRIMSIIFFFSGYFGAETSHGKKEVFRLKGLSEQSPYIGLRFEDLAESDQRKLRNSVLRAINIKQLSPKAENTSVYHIFERLNTGGTALKPQEIRNCVYRGEIVPALRRLNEDKNWRKILGKPDPDKYQKDVELVLRLFSLFQNWKNYEKPMKDYLNNFMNKQKNFSSSQAKKFTKAFPEACAYVVEELGPKPFSTRGPLNTSILDAVMCVILENINRDIKNLPGRYKTLLENDDFESKIRGATTDTAAVRDRIALAEEVLVG